MHIPFATNASYPVRRGNRVRPLVDGEPAFRRICEAIETARHSVWLTVAFLEEGFAMPDGRGSLFDVLDRAAARGLDVRAIFWRLNDVAGFPNNEVFSGNAEHHAMLSARGARFLARWDRAHKIYCQHQKSWLIDAGQHGEIAFVGGINLHVGSVVSPGHGAGPEDQAHDVYAELLGPAATDVHHNFVQRWNEASERGLDGGAWPGTSHAEDLAFPRQLSPEAGEAVVQIQRTVRAGHYTDSTPTPGGSAFAIAEGETSIFEQYQRAIAAARSSIYLENQALGCPRTLEALHDALKRGVEVVVLTPAKASPFMSAARKDPRSQAFFTRFDALAEHERFALVGIAAQREGRRRNVYVHAKTALIDDAWATIGSCNIGARSFFGDTELNASFWDPATARRLRVELLREHLGIDTSACADREALALYRERAAENARALAHGAELGGIAFALDPREYART